MHLLGRLPPSLYMDIFYGQHGVYGMVWGLGMALFPFRLKTMHGVGEPVSTAAFYLFMNRSGIGWVSSIIVTFT